MAVSYLIPKLQTRLAAIWLPLDPVDLSDEACRRFLLPWKLLLEHKSLHNLAEAMDPYHKLIWQGWMPMLRNVISQWKCQESGPMIDLLDRWEPLLPDWIMDQIKTLLLRRIWSDIDAWNPNTDPAPIHNWIHPWIPRLGDELLLCSVLLEILPKALVDWEPSDGSARSLLMAWMPFVANPYIERFVVENVLPKLRRALYLWTVHSDLPSQDWRKNLNFWRKSKNVKFNYNFLKIDVWKWVMEWRDLIPVPCYLTILEQCFFRKWFKALAALIKRQNYEEVAIWYYAWKSYFPKEILQCPEVEGSINNLHFSQSLIELFVIYLFSAIFSGSGYDQRHIRRWKSIFHSASSSSS